MYTIQVGCLSIWMIWLPGKIVCQMFMMRWQKENFHSLNQTGNLAEWQPIKVHEQNKIIRDVGGGSNL